MGWDNPPVPWREFERRLSWRQEGDKAALSDLNAGAEGQGATGQDGRGPGEGVAGQGVAGQGARAEPWLPWAELHCHSAYSFLDGASDPEKLITEATALGLSAIAITDHDGMYGVPQFAQAAARVRRRTAAGEETGTGTGTRGGVRTVFGAELGLTRGTGRTGMPDPAGQHLLVLARDPEGYRRLCRVISDAHLAGGEKGRPDYDIEQLAAAHDGHWVVLTGCRKGAVPAALTGAGAGDLDLPAARAELDSLTGMFGHESVMVELISHGQPTDDERNDALFELARQASVGVVATSNVHYATPADARLAQVLAAIRARSSLDDIDGWLAASGGAYLRSGAEMARRLRRYPGVYERTVELGERCAFDFGVIAPRLPDFPVPGGGSEMSYLRKLVATKAPRRYGRAGRRAHPRRLPSDRPRARRHRPARVRRVLPDRPRHRQVLR